ncbi:MAG: Fic family protein [Egibacteraceae bacterium]
MRSLHFMLLGHEFTKGPGRYRLGAIYVSHAATGEVVYEGPDAVAVPALVDELLAGLANDRGQGPPIVRAAMAYLNLVMIHPFRDGNGRLARILQSLVLAREEILAPEFASIEEYLGRHARDYYAVLAEVGGGTWQPERGPRPWIRFCLAAHLGQARTLLRRLEEAERLWLQVEELAAQKRLPPRVVGALVFASHGHRLRRGIYRALVEEDITEATATRDLARLVGAGLLEPIGEKRARRYLATDQLRTMRAAVRRTLPPPPDPFAAELTGSGG